MIGLRLRLVSAGLLLVLVACGAEEPVPPALDLMVVSDSNGVSLDSWPFRLQQALMAARGEDAVRLHNASRRGRTLFVDRGGSATTAVRGIGAWIEGATAQSDGTIDVVLLCLGTNDAQAAFSHLDMAGADTIEAVSRVIDLVEQNAPRASLVLSTPPPTCDPSPGPGHGRQIDPRWRGSRTRLTALGKVLRDLASKRGVPFVDLANEYRIDPCDAVEDDGVHLNETGHREISRILADFLGPVVRNPKDASGPNAGSSSSVDSGE